MADRADRLALVEEVAHEAHGVLVLTQVVGVPDAAGEDERVVVVRACLLDRLVDLERAGFVVVVEALDLAVLQRNELELGTGILERLPRPRQLGLLEPERNAGVSIRSGSMGSISEESELLHRTERRAIGPHNCYGNKNPVRRESIFQKQTRQRCIIRLQG